MRKDAETHRKGKEVLSKDTLGEYLIGVVDWSVPENLFRSEKKKSNEPPLKKNTIPAYCSVQPANDTYIIIGV